MRKLAGSILALWLLSAAVASLHSHCGNCCCGRKPKPKTTDEAPCSICLAVEHVPLVASARAETFEGERDVVAWISPWIALVPDEVFYDRPLARGPPAAS
jgi:hypothetical protein